MGAYPPFRPAPQYNTPLNPLDEMAFREWVSKNSIPFNPTAPSSDYDMRGYWLAQNRGQPMAGPTQINPNDNAPHFTDYYKTPQHNSFSAESQWAGANAPNWINESQLVSPSGRVVFDEAQPRPDDVSIDALVRALMQGQ